MTEEEARAYIEGIGGSQGADSVDRFVAMVIAENERQNLVARTSIESIWSRHAADSAQLVRFASGRSGRWLDVGTGGGFPGMIVAILRDETVALVEPRRRRAEFLEYAAGALGISSRVTVLATMVEKISLASSVISARAVASVDKLLESAAACATLDTRWILPRGKVDRQQLTDIQTRWEGMFHVEQSLTSDASDILILDKVARR